MIALSDIFKEANSKASKNRDVLVFVEDVTLFDEKTTETDWGANTSESDIDYTSSPPDAGNVELTRLAVPPQQQLTGNTWSVVYQKYNPTLGPVEITENQHWQSFKHDIGYKVLNTVDAYFKRSATGSGHKAYCSIWDATKTIQYGSQVEMAIGSLSGQAYTFVFTSQGISIESGLTYWMKFEGAVDDPGIEDTDSVSQYYQNTDVYANGEFIRTGDSPATGLGDVYFGNSFTGDYFEDSGWIKTDNIDIGEVPTVDGEWTIDDVSSPESALWVCDSTTDKIYNILPDGTLGNSFLISVYDAAATLPLDISYADNGTLWVTDFTTTKIYNIELDGTLINSFATSVYDVLSTNPSGISHADDDTLWVCDNATDKIYNIQTNGTLISSFATSVYDASAINPTGISYGPDGTLWVCDGTTDKIYNIETDGTLISSFSTSVYDASALQITGISYADDDTLWTCDNATNKIYNIEKNGALISSFATSVFDAGATQPTGVTGGYKNKLSYEAWSSTTGAFAGEEVYRGVIYDGLAVTNLIRYWRVKARMSSNVEKYLSPRLQTIKLDYTTYHKLNTVPDLGYEPIVDSVASLTSKIDFFKPASIGQMSVSLVMTDSISDWVYNETLYNKLVHVKLGFNYEGFVEADYINYFRGAIDDWIVDDGILKLTLKDLSKEWKLPVPTKWETAGDDVTYTNQHHTDVMLDIFQNKINVRDSGLLFDSFATVKANTAAYKVTRTITGAPEDAKKLVEELRVLLFAFFLPSGEGKIGIKQFDKDEAIVTTFTDDNTLSIAWSANANSLINRTALYFNWDGAGDKESDFSEYDAGDDTTSQADFRAIKPYILKDKWTRTAEAAQISALETKILDQFDTMPSMVTINCDAKDIAYEAGDMVGVTTLNAPGANGAGIEDEKYLIISKNMDFLGDKIVFKGLKVIV